MYSDSIPALGKARYAATKKSKQSVFFAKKACSEQ
jgi:hypothetical protein